MSNEQILITLIVETGSKKHYDLLNFLTKKEYQFASQPQPAQQSVEDIYNSKLYFNKWMGELKDYEKQLIIDMMEEYHHAQSV